MEKREQKNGGSRHRQDDAGFKTWRILILIFLAAAPFVIYWQIQGHEYMNFDDHIYVTDNEHVKAGLSRESLAWAFIRAIDLSPIRS